MTRFLFATAFLLGAAAIVWMGSVFLGSDALGLTVTVVIGGVYAIGFIELIQFRQETSTLSNALSALSKTASGNGAEKITDLGEWLDKLHPSLQNSVRLRIEGERVGLPAPVLSPYLVGLLVMLGLLGTFMGMVDTLKGAVVALQGTTELQAIRAGLAAPIKGLGLSFGTSVAGVAASAMLGLISTLSRRDRMLATRRLDTKIATVFREFSLIHNRQETYKALQMQAQALPEVAEKLQTMAGKLESMGDKLGDKLIANQEMFHQSVKSIYAELATSVDNSLKESLAESGRMAGESIKPIVKEAMAEISNEARNTHQQLSLTAQQQLETLTERFTQTSEQVTDAWKTGLQAHQSSNEILIEGMSASYETFSGKFGLMSESMLASFENTSSSWLERQSSGDQERLNLWGDSFERAQRLAATQYEDTSKIFTAELGRLTELQQTSFKTVSQDFETMSSALTAQWQQAGEQSLSHQQAISATLEKTADDMIDNARSTSTTMLNEMSGLLSTSEDLILARVEAEESWLNGHGERMDKLTSTLKTELEALRNEEEGRAQTAVERMAGLESTVSAHLVSLGKELEGPMCRLIETASETPRAAAEVIEHLRREISKNVERDNSLLEERRSIMEDLTTLSGSLAQASSAQQQAVEMLVKSSANMLEDVGSRFTEHVGSQVSTISTIADKLAGSATEIADNFAGSATEMSSLGDAFGLAVQLFNESNGQLVEHLIRIEQSLDKSSSRSDEQLGYYVAQAREMIDHSMNSQREIFDELRRLSRKDDLIAEAVPAEVN